MMIRKKLSAGLLSLLLLLCLPAAALAEAPIEKWNRYNVVLVVDKSGSLCSEGERGTDPDGLRYEALKLFLGLLTERGNNVGVVVFDEHIRYESAVAPLTGMDEKKALIQTIEGYAPCYDTDIGKAMLRATELLREMREKQLQEDGAALPSMIILFSDGMTDFLSGDILSRLRTSYENAQTALDTAMEDDITINGIRLNVDGAADRGKYEFQVYTANTDGEFEEVRQPEDLTNAFRRLYQMINKTEYAGDRRVSLSEQGEAEIHFAVPPFGVEEVNVIVEGEALRAGDGGESMELDVLRPDGSRYDTTGHALESSSYQFVKLPEMVPGIWTVRLKGAPDARADISMVCNATLNVTLDPDEFPSSCRTNTPYRFFADVAVSFDDPAAQALTAEQLSALEVLLVREELATGAVREYRMDYEDGCYTVDTVNFPRGGTYALSALVDLGDFRKSSDIWEIDVMPEPPVAQVERITDMLGYGHFRDGLWELALPELFGVGSGSEVEYTLSSDCGGLARIEGELLQIGLEDEAQPLAFTLTATDQMGQSAAIPFELTVPAVYAKTGLISDITEQGVFLDPEWELPLDELFEDPKDLPLEYSLSDDCGGAVTIEDGILRAQLQEGRPLSFVLTATDQLNQSARVTFDLSIPTVTAKLDKISSLMQSGSLHDFEWELALDGLFSDPQGQALEYALSDDYGGAAAVEDGVLRVDFHELREVNFDLSASNALGRKAVIPVSLKVPGPSASLSGIAETVKTGLFQENIWEQRIDGLFREPKGTDLRYSLSDDLGGAAKIEDGTLRVNMKGLKKADFSLIATDAYDLSAEVPVALAGKNMTLIYLLWALLGLLLIGVPIAVVIYLRRR